MPAQSLHPNLARLAAAYDDVMERYQRRMLTAGQARDRILALVARDDNGVQWSISPDSGRWQYRNARGDLVDGEPPAFGVATHTAHDVADNPDAFNPDHRIAFYEVDQTLLSAPGALPGSTLLSAAPRTRRWPQVAALVGLLVVVAVVAALLF